VTSHRDGDREGEGRRLPNHGRILVIVA